MLDEGELVEHTAGRVDSRGRHRTITVVLLPGCATGPTIEAVDAAELRVGLEQLGMTPDEFALQAGVHVKTLRNWLTGQRPVPRGRWNDLRSLLNPSVTGQQLRYARVKAGWTLAYVAQRYFQRHLSQLHHWEQGDRPIPKALQIVASRFIREAHHAAERGELLDREVDRVVRHIGRHAGTTRRTLLHMMRARSHGRGRPQLESKLAVDAVQAALDRGLIAEAVGHTVDRQGRPTRMQLRLYPAGGSPQPVAPITGGELRERRLRMASHWPKLAAAAG
jgi:DNA-binding transcriptional regulator YiaG